MHKKVFVNVTTEDGELLDRVEVPLACTEEGTQGLNETKIYFTPLSSTLQAPAASFATIRIPTAKFHSLTSHEDEE